MAANVLFYFLKIWYRKSS